MRPLVLLLACSACSLVLDTDDLRGLQDGAPPDDAEPDVPMSDAGGNPDADAGGDGAADAGDDGSRDAGCTTPAFTGLRESRGRLTAVFNRPAELPEGVRYQVTFIPDLPGDVILPMGQQDVALPFPIPLFFEGLSVTLRDQAGCERGTHPVPEESQHTLEILNATPDGYFVSPGVDANPSFGATMDIANDGTIVFAGQTPPGTGDDTAYRWHIDGSFELVAPEGTGGGLLAPRISDDGSLVTYYDRADQLFHFVELSSGDAGKFDSAGAGGDQRTISVTNDLRGDALSGYRFIMRAYLGEASDDVIFDGSFNADVLVPNATVSLDLSVSSLRSPVLPAGGSANLFSAVEVGSDSPRPVVVASSVATFYDCNVQNVDTGLAVTDGTQIALVGACGSDAGVNFCVGADGGYDCEDVTNYDGLLAASDDFTTFLVRGVDEGRSVGSRSIIRLSDGDPGFVLRSLHGTESVHVGVTYLSVAALSPNGRWAALALTYTDSTARDSYRIARVRVQ